jgi:hypothetical protein
MNETLPLDIGEWPHEQPCPREPDEERGVPRHLRQVGRQETLPLSPANTTSTTVIPLLKETRGGGTASRDWRSVANGHRGRDERGDGGTERAGMARRGSQRTKRRAGGKTRTTGLKRRDMNGAARGVAWVAARSRTTGAVPQGPTRTSATKSEPAEKT